MQGFRNDLLDSSKDALIKSQCNGVSPYLLQLTRKGISLYLLQFPRKGCQPVYDSIHNEGVSTRISFDTQGKAFGLYVLQFPMKGVCLYLLRFTMERCQLVFAYLE